MCHIALDLSTSTNRQVRDTSAFTCRALDMRVLISNCMLSILVTLLPRWAKLSTIVNYSSLSIALGITNVPV